MAQHELDRSGVDLDGHHYVRCTCDWQSPGFADADDAADAVAAHVARVDPHVVTMSTIWATPRPRFVVECSCGWLSYSLSTAGMASSEAARHLEEAGHLEVDYP